MKKIFASILALAMMFVLSVPTFAVSSMTFDEAKNYLETYKVSKENSEGKEYTIQYTFKSEEDLNKAAEYIVEYGLNAFNSTLDNAITDAVSKEPQRTTVLPRTTTPTTIYKTISEDGIHYINEEVAGLASFDSLGTVEYVAELGYRVTVTDGKFTNLTSISFDVSYISTAGSWGDTYFPSYCQDYYCGVTANYVITKTIEVDMGAGFEVGILSETDPENFAILCSMA